MTAAGVNLPAIWAECVTGGSTDPLAPKPGQLQEGSFASEKVCLQKYFADDMSWADLKSVTGASRYLFVASEDDPAPYRAMMKQARVNRMKRGVKKLASWAKPAAKKNLRRVKEK